MNIIRNISAASWHTKYFSVVPNTLNCKIGMDANNSSSSSESWRGVPITEILGAQSPWSTPEFPLVTPSYNHTVLYHVGNNGAVPMDRPPKPHIGHEKWDHDFVRMPCSNQSLYPVEDSHGKTHLKKRWDIIQEALQKSIRNSRDLANVILSYNTKFRNIWTFRSLHMLLNEYIDTDEADMFFKVTLPQIAKMALALPKLIQCPIPLLKQHENRSVSLSQQQIASLLANAFFCTFPRRNTTKRTSEYSNYPHINFTTLYEASPSESVLEKLKCLCNYLRRVCTKVSVGVVTVSRRHVPIARCPAWPASSQALATVPLYVDSSTTIEDAHGLIQFDFANKYLGGGVLGYGCVQEEIRFVICPELLVTMLFTEMLRPDEAVIIIGSERYSKYTGYGNSFQFTGNYEDTTPYDSSGRRRCAVLAVDALPFSDERVEFKPAMITRELNKAWIGISFETDTESDQIQYPGVATGNWGCGAFGGTPQLKSLLQLMACAQAKRPIAYYTFGDVRLRDDIIEVYNVLTRNDVTVGELYKYITRFSQSADVTQSNLHKFLCRLLKEDKKVPQQKKSPLESMDTGVGVVETYNLSSSIEIEFESNSPDLFTEDDTEVYNEITHKDADTNKDASTKIDASTKKRELCIKNDPSTSDNKTSGSGSRLFDEMEKFDGDNGKLNFTSSKQSDTAAKIEEVGVESDAIRLDLAADVKKKISRKITDYFNKKT